MGKDDARNFITVVIVLFGIFLLINGFQAYQATKNLLNQETIVFFLSGALFLAIAYFAIKK